MNKQIAVERAARKERFVHQLKKFVESGFQKRLFTREFYAQLSNCFFHIAHYNREGFWDTWFSTPQRQLVWLNRVKSTHICGDPNFCYSDVELEIQTWLKQHPEFWERVVANIHPTWEERVTTFIHDVASDAKVQEFCSHIALRAKELQS